MEYQPVSSCATRSEVRLDAIRLFRLIVVVIIECSRPLPLLFHTDNSYAHADVEGISSIGFVSGAGAALNCILPLVNTVGMDDWLKMSNEGLHRSKDPGVGAFTPFYDRQLLARGEIPPGDELFDSYGEAYFADREAVFGKIPLHETDHETADALLNTYVGLRDQLCADSNVKCSTSEAEEGTLHQDWYSLMTKLSSVWPSRALGALPKDPTQVEEIAQIGTVYTDYSRSRRSIEWLEENGACMDNIVPGTSSIPQAGRGAFAKRFIPEGGLVGPAPALHVKRHLMSMYPTTYDEKTGELVADTSRMPIHAQLLLNYCFGHRHSSLLLCPYGAVTQLINHAPKEKANARIVWDRKLMQHPEWLDQPLDEFIYGTHAGLMFDYIATKDIQPGEEVLIYYGKEWEGKLRFLKLVRPSSVQSMLPYC